MTTKLEDRPLLSLSVAKNGYRYMLKDKGGMFFVADFKDGRWFEPVPKDHPMHCAIEVPYTPAHIVESPDA